MSTRGGGSTHCYDKPLSELGKHDAFYFDWPATIATNASSMRLSLTYAYKVSRTIPFRRDRL
jgi:hypothetical protein